MSHLLTIFLIFVFTLSLIIVLIGEIAFYGKNIDMDTQYLDEDDDHIYYDRSLIEKKLFCRRFPNVSIRSFSRLFRGE